jgi:membrane protease YdiL (CAAX protease family)
VGNAVLPAVFEEAALRGLVLTALATMMSRRRAIVISALLFAAIHGRIERMPDTFISGVIYGWIFVRTGSLLPSMLVHFLHNTGCVLADLTAAESETGWTLVGVPLDGYNLLPAWIAWCAALLLLLALLGIRKVRPTSTPAPAGYWASQPG